MEAAPPSQKRRKRESRSGDHAPDAGTEPGGRDCWEAWLMQRPFSAIPRLRRIVGTAKSRRFRLMKSAEKPERSRRAAVIGSVHPHRARIYGGERQMKPMSAALLLATTSLVLLEPNVARAQSTGSERDLMGLDEVTVTARRREESLQEVPLSITAFSTEEIRRAGIAGFGDVAKLTPSLVFDQEFGANDTRPTIRGLPATRGRPPVGVLIDGIDVSSEALATAGGGNLLNLRLLDLERIEVVKGPQSALYGRVAFGGAVNYVTARPDDTFSGRVTAMAGNGETYEVAGSIGGPLGDSGLRARLYGGYSRADGFFRNVVSGRNLGGHEAAQVSLSFDYDAGERFSLRGFLSYGDQENEQQPYYQYSTIDNSTALLPLPVNVAGQMTGNLTLPAAIRSLLPGPLRPRDTVQVSLDPRTNRDYEGSTLTSTFATTQGTWKFGAARLDVTLGLLDADSSNLQDIEGYGRPLAQVSLPAPGGLAEPLGSAFEFNSDDEVRQLTQELRLSNLEDETTRWAVGVLRWTEDARQVNRTLATILFAPGASAGLNQRLVNSNITPSLNGRDTEHLSVYALFERNLTRRLSLGLEARYYWEDFEYDFPTGSLVLGAGTTPIPAPPRPPQVTDIKLDATYFAPKATLEFEATDDARFYASAGKGVKPAGISTVGTFNNIADNSYDAETLWNYELGAKTSWLDSRVVVNGAVFFMDYEDKQVSALVVDTAQPTGLRSVISNASGAEVRGLELETSLFITRQLRLTAAYTFLDAEYTDFTELSRNATNIALAGNCQPVVVGSGSQSNQCRLDLSGNSLERAPRHAASMTLGYTVPLGERSSLLTELAAQYQGKRYFDQYNALYFDSFANVDARVTWEGERWSVTAFVNNLLDDDTIRSGFTQGDFFGLLSSPGSRSFVVIATEPIRGGLRASYRF
jgi:outer membrane receptor protein involved in Fe transport